MANNIKVIEIITVKGWMDGSGWSYEQNYSYKIVEIPASYLTPGFKMDWSWWEPSDKFDGEDVEITVKYYDLDADPCTDAPIAKWSTWESELGCQADVQGEAGNTMTTKYTVVDQIRNGDTFDTYHDTLESALGAAEKEWEHMSQYDRNRRSDFFVGPAEYSEDDDCWVYTGHVIKAWKLNGEEV